jgi:signal recognition particle subunit SRP54
MGDVLTLIEQAERTFDQAQQAEMARKFTEGEDFTLDDFLQQMQQLRKMGSMSKIFGMLPGMGQFREQIENIDERELDRTQAIIQSMTPLERRNPKLLNASRRSRIARGSGMSVSAVNDLVERFAQAQQMMRTLTGGGIPGMPGFGKKAKGRQAPQQKRSKGGKVSGNPAKRAAVEAQRAARPSAPAESPFGPGVGGDGGSPFELPANLRDLLPPGGR